MTLVTLSPKFQVVIPSTIRKAKKLKPGSKFQVIAYDGRIELVEIQSIKVLKGILKGIDTSIPRLKDRL